MNKSKIFKSGLILLALILAVVFLAHKAPNKSATVSPASYSKISFVQSGANVGPDSAVYLAKETTIGSTTYKVFSPKMNAEDMTGASINANQ